MRGLSTRIRSARRSARPGSIPGTARGTHRYAPKSCRAPLLAGRGRHGAALCSPCELRLGPPAGGASGQRLTPQVLGSPDPDEDGIALLFRVALLLRLDQPVPGLFIDRSEFVDLRPSVEPQDAA